MEQQRPTRASLSKKTWFSKPLNSLIGVTIVATGLLLNGCGTTPNITASKADLSVAANNIMRSHIELKSLRDACAQAGGQAEVHADSVYQQWLLKNWPLVIGADGFNRAHLQDKTLSFDGQTLSLPALKFLAETTRTAEHKVAFIQRSRTNRNKTCRRKLELFDAEHHYGLQPVEEYIQTSLNSYAASHTAPPKAGARVPTLAGNLSVNGLPGRSLYAIEGQAKDMPCAAPQIFTFKNQWPLEIYAAFCSQEQRLITCEWGNCSTQ